MPLFEDDKKPLGSASQKADFPSRIRRVKNAQNAFVKWYNSSQQKSFRRKTWNNMNRELERQGIALWELGVVLATLVGGIILIIVK